MPLVLNAGPAIEPATLAEAKAHCRIDGTEEDALLQSLIVAARLFLERKLDIALITQSWSLYLDGWPDDGVVHLPLWPTQAIETVRIFDAGGGAHDVEPATYFLDAASRPPRLVRRGAAVWPQPGQAANGVRIDLLAGYGDAPDDVPLTLRQAILMLVAYWFEAREGVIEGVSAFDAPYGFDKLVAPYRQARL